MAGLQNLEQPGLPQTKITNACLKDLAAMKGLRQVILSNSGVTISGLMEHAASLQHLKNAAHQFQPPFRRDNR